MFVPGVDQLSLRRTSRGYAFDSPLVDSSAHWRIDNLHINDRYKHHHQLPSDTVNYTEIVDTSVPTQVHLFSSYRFDGRSISVEVARRVRGTRRIYRSKTHCRPKTLHFIGPTNRWSDRGFGFPNLLLPKEREHHRLGGRMVPLYYGCRLK